MKKMYKISYSGILNYGYVTIELIGKSGSRKTTKPPTLFTLKFVADITCWFLNKTDNDFNTFKVTEFEKMPTNNFIKDCLLFRQREAFFIRMGIFSWIAIISLIAVASVTGHYVIKYLQI